MEPLLFKWNHQFKNADLSVWGNNTNKLMSYVYVITDPYDFGDITLCPPVQTGPNKVTLTGGQFSTPTTFTNFNDNKNGFIIYDSTGTPKHISTSSYGTDGSFYVFTNGISTGTYQIDATSQTSVSFYMNTTFTDQISTGTVSITRVGLIGTGLIEGTFTGQTTSGVQASGQFSVPRGPNQYN